MPAPSYFDDDFMPMPPPLICSHRWIDPKDPPIARAPYSPWLGPKRREMKAGRIYECQNCDAVLVAPKTAEGAV